MTTGAGAGAGAGATIRKSEAGDVCPICLEQYANGDELVRLMNCKHSMHAACIRTWLKTHPSCPLCRAKCCNVFT